MVGTEMTCVSPGRAASLRPAPACGTTSSSDAWKRIVDFVHTNTDAKIALQLGHSGRKGSTRRGWEGIDLPLDAGNWPLVSASPIPYIDGVSQIPARSHARGHGRILDAVCRRHAPRRRRRIRLARAPLRPRLSALELSSRPLTNQRTDEYGGSLDNRCRFPLEVFRAMREVWPAEKPMSVRISANDWVPGGLTPEDAADVARLFNAAGADVIDCSSGQVSKAEKPVYGRMFQVPFSDRIRNEAGVPTIAVGNIFEGDHVNTIIAAGRADLCAIARPHLADPCVDAPRSREAGLQRHQMARSIFVGQGTIGAQHRARSIAGASVSQPVQSTSSQLLAGKHALVTGGSRGIGAVIASSLMDHGARVTVLGRSVAVPADSSSTQRDNRIAITADVTDSASVLALSIRPARSSARSPSSLTMQARPLPLHSSKPMPPSGAACTPSISTAHFTASQAALPDMLAAGWGRIVNVASTAGLTGFGYITAYCASKHAVIGLTRSLALEVAMKGITVNAVCPGYTDTDMVKETVANIVAKTGRTAEQALAELTVAKSSEAIDQAGRSGQRGRLALPAGIRSDHRTSDRDLRRRGDVKRLWPQHL